ELRRLIAQRLEQCVDPTTGARVVERVIRKEDVYQGPYLADMPDLLLVLAPGYELVESFDPDHLFIDSLEWKRTGTHRPEGIFLIAGPGIAVGRRLEGARLLDVCPTVLHLLGVPLPDDMDGVPLDVLEESYRALHPIEYTAAVSKSV